MPTSPTSIPDFRLPAWRFCLAQSARIYRSSATQPGQARTSQPCSLASRECAEAHGNPEKQRKTDRDLFSELLASSHFLTNATLVARYYTAETLASQPPVRCPSRKAKAGGVVELSLHFWTSSQGFFAVTNSGLPPANRRQFSRAHHAPVTSLHLTES